LYYNTEIRTEMDALVYLLVKFLSTRFKPSHSTSKDEGSW